MNADDIDEVTELVTHLSVNDFLLTFAEDTQAVQFKDWWHSVGKKAFIRWANKQANQPTKDDE